MKITRDRGLTTKASQPPGNSSNGGALVAERMPAPFLDVRVQRLERLPGLIGLCAGYEDGAWRSKQLASHMFEWLPDFALTYEERQAVGPDTAVRVMRAVARTIYNTKKFEQRGEFGELLLHIAIRQVFQTLPAVSKVYYKDGPNEIVKGFDAVHVVLDEKSLELWLGEAKFYADIHAAITAVVAELQKHGEREYLRTEFAAIVNKIDPKWPHADRLKKLLDPNTSLDKVFDAMCIPILLTYDSDAVGAHTRVCSEYQHAFENEVARHHATFCGKGLPDQLRVHLFLVPLKSKQELLQHLDAELRKWQNL